MANQENHTPADTERDTRPRHTDPKLRGALLAALSTVVPMIGPAIGLDLTPKRPPGMIRGRV